MMNTVAPYLQIFTFTFLGFALLSLVGGNISVRGHQLVLLTHPIIVRVRYFAFGLFIALLSQRYDWQHPGGVGFVTALLLLVSAIRVRLPAENNVSGVPGNYATARGA